MLKVKKHLIWIIVAALLGGAGAYAVSTWLMTPVYTPVSYTHLRAHET